MPRRAWLFVGAAGLLLGLLDQLDGAGPALGAAVAVGGSVTLALLAHGATPLASEAVIFGAGGALAHEAARPYLPLIATGLLLAAVFATRAARSRTWRELASHLGLAFFAGVGASWVLEARGADARLWLLALVVAALLASTPWLLPADAVRAFALRRLAGRARGPLRVALLRAAAAHRRLSGLALPPDVARRADEAFDALRVRSERYLDGASVEAADLSRRAAALARLARAARRREALLERLEAAPDQDTGALAAEAAALEELLRGQR